MNRTKLYELAVATAKASLQETNPIALAAAVVKAAQDDKVAPQDFPTFQQYVNQGRNQYKQLAQQKLPSELAQPTQPAVPAKVK